MVEKNIEEKSVKSKEEKPAKYQLYQCYVDLSELVFPGSKYKYKSILNNK